MELQAKWNSLRGRLWPCLSASEIKGMNDLTHLCPSHLYIGWGTSTLSYTRGMSVHGLWLGGVGEQSEPTCHLSSQSPALLEPQNLPRRSTPSDWQAAVTEVWQQRPATPSTVLLFEYSDQCGQGAGLPASWQRLSRWEVRLSLLKGFPRRTCS